MGLIITGEMTMGTSPTAGVSPFYLAVEKDKLSRPYQIIPFTCYVEGTILEIKNRFRELSQDEREIVDKYVKGKKVEFYLSVVLWIGSYDYLYFTEDSWAILRDAGIIGGDYTLSVRLIKAKIGERVNELYPLRDIA